MRWEDERYVRLYTRDTPEWCTLSFGARGLFCLLLRAVDRAGILPLGKLGPKGVAVSVRGAWTEVEPFLAELLSDGCVTLRDETLLIPGYMAAQEAIQTDAARKRASRERARASVTQRPATVTPRDTVESRNGTPCPAVSGGGDKKSLLSDPIRSDPSLSDPPYPPNGRGRSDEGTPEAQSPEPAEPERPKTESPFDMALRIYAEHFAKRHGRAFMLTSFGSTSSDESALMRVGRLAEAKGEMERWLRHWMRAFLRDDEKWLVDNAHPPRQLERRLNKYGEPKKPRPILPKQEPPPEPSHTFTKLEPVTQPATLRKVPSTPEELAARAIADKARLAALEFGERKS